MRRIYIVIFFFLLSALLQCCAQPLKKPMSQDIVHFKNVYIQIFLIQPKLMFSQNGYTISERYAEDERNVYTLGHSDYEVSQILYEVLKKKFETRFPNIAVSSSGHTNVDATLVLYIEQYGYDSQRHGLFNFPGVPIIALHSFLIEGTSPNLKSSIDWKNGESPLPIGEESKIIWAEPITYVTATQIKETLISDTYGDVAVTMGNVPESEEESPHFPILRPEDRGGGSFTEHMIAAASNVSDIILWSLSGNRIEDFIKADLLNEIPNVDLEQETMD